MLEINLKETQSRHMDPGSSIIKWSLESNEIIIECNWLSVEPE